MMNFFQDLLKGTARAVLPKETEYKLGLTQRPMEFRVGEGMTAEQTKKAKETISKPSGISEGNFFADVVRAFPRAGARVGIEAGKQILGLSEAEVQPKTKMERFIFGEEPIKDIPTYGKETLKGFGLGEEKAGKYGILAGLGLTALDLYPGGLGKKQIVEKIAKETSESVIKDLIINNVKNIAEENVDDLARKLVKVTNPKEVESILEKSLSYRKSGYDEKAFEELRKISQIDKPIPIISKELQPLAQEARKYKTAEEFVKKIDDERTIFTTKDGKSSAVVTESVVKYELADDLTSAELEKLGVDEDSFITKLEHLEVSENQRNKGLGTKLFEEQLKDAIKRPNDLIYLNASPMGGKGLSLPELTKFYEKYGFRVIKKQGNNNLMVATKSQLTDFWEKAVKGVSGGEMAPKAIPKAAVNIERLNIPQEAKQKIIKASEEIKPQLEAVKGKVLTNDEVVEAAKASEILRRGTTREATLKSEATLLKTREHLAQLAKNEKLTPEFIETLKTVSEEATRRGRELQALGIEADPSLGTIKTKLVKQLIDIGIETDKIIKGAEGVDFNNAKQVTEFYRKFVKPKFAEIIDEYRYINMLSSPKTQIVNTFSNILQTAILRPATRLASGVIDTFGHLLTGKEQQFYVSQVPAYYKGAFNAFGDALSEGLRVMRGQQQVYRPDIKNIPTGLKIFKPFQVIPRLMEASDVFFRKIATAGEVEALMSKGMKEAEAVSKAAKTAEELVFRKALDPSNKTGQGILLSKIDALTTAVYKLRNVPGVKWFIPFVQTPMNILKQGIEYSPLGVTTLPGNANIIEQFGKTLVGTTVFAGAGWLTLQDRTTWAVPTNTKEKDAFYAAGMQPYSVKIGDTWVSYSRLGPLAYPIAMATAIKFYTKDNPKAVGDTELQKITKILSGIAQFFTDQSYVQGIGDFVNLAQGDVTALTRAVSQLPSQLIPLTALQRWVANIIDPIYRKTDKKLSVEGIIENLKSGIPGLTKGIPAYTTPSGEEEKRQYRFLNPLSPITISEESSEWKDYFKTLQQVSSERVLETKSKEQLKQSTQDLYDKMKILPKEEAKRQFDDLMQTNPKLAKEISELAKEIKLDYRESFLKSLGVENGQRAKYIVEELNKLETKEEKKSYYQNLINKKVITKEVGKQISFLLK